MTNPSAPNLPDPDPANDPASRIQRVSHPAMSPGNCGICGKNEHEKGFADPRMDFEFYGTLYFCRDCAGQFGAVFGYVAPETLADLRVHMAAQDEELRVLRLSLVALENTVDALTASNAAYRNRDNERSRSDRADAGAEPQPEVSIESKPEPVSERPLGPESVVTVQADGRDQSGSKSGPDDLRNVTAGADELLGL